MPCRKVSGQAPFWAARPDHCPASHEPLVLPLPVDALRLAREGRDGLGWGGLPLCDLGEHLRNQERVVDLVHHRRCVARMARVRCVLLGDRREDGVLASRLVRVLRGQLADLLEPALDRARPGREVVVLAANEVLAVAELLVDQVLLRGRLVLRELPDHEDAHDVLVAQAHHWTAGIEESQVSAERAIEIAFSATDSRPARNAWLFDAAVHAKTSSDMPLR